jgi:hypothetical protein
MRMYSGGGYSQVAGGPNGERRSRNLVTASVWLIAALACIALATLEHERAKSGGGRSILCGTFMSCADSVEPSSLEAACATGPNAGNLPPCDTSTGTDYDDSNDIFSFGGEARDNGVPKDHFGR